MAEDKTHRDRREPHVPDVGMRATGTTANSSADPSDAADPWIGPYHLLERIGIGGFGEVYAAEQMEPVKRRVALKIIKLGMDTKAVIARFEAERQALAMMDHPSIARIFDAGTSARGRPYFVMELVRGVPITQYCDDQRLSIRERLELFVQVCHAVQHAHQKGVIHRDLKPSNIFVTLLDGRPVPKVIDFGIAKATDHRLTESTLYTRQGEFIGTPEYMSPEQAEITGLDVDTRTDVYSLGVLLYELLTGTLPLDHETLRGAGFSDIVRRIRESEPPRPSTRLSTIRTESSRSHPVVLSPKQGLAQRTIIEVAARRRTEPRLLRNSVRGDLDWITMRCLEKDRTRRYETANALALDVLRHLDDEVVLAGPPSNRYRLGKFARRHRLAIGVGVAVGLALLTGLGLATFGLLQAKRERDLARLAEANAQSEARKSAAVGNFLQEMLASADPSNTRGAALTVRDALDAAAKRVDTGAFKGEPEIEAAVRLTIGDTYRALGLFAPAETNYRTALEIRRRIMGPADPQTTESMVTLATLLYYVSRTAEAESLCRQALAIDMKSARSLDRAFGSNVTREVTTLGFILEDRQEYAAAESLYRAALAINGRVLPRRSGEIATDLSNLAGVLAREERFAEAESLFREVLSIDDAVYGHEHPEVGTDLHRFAVLLRDTGRRDEAESYFRQALAIRRKVLGEDHPDVGMTLYDLATLLEREGRLAPAESLLRQATAIDEKAYGEGEDLASDLQRLGSLLEKRGKLSEAEAFYRRALEMRERSQGVEGLDVASSLVYLGDLLVSRGEPGKAEPLLRRAISIRRAHLPPGDWKSLNAQVFLGKCLTALGRYDEAEHNLLEAEAGLRIASQTPAGYRAEAARQLAKLYRVWGKPEKAAVWQAIRE